MVNDKILNIKIPSELHENLKCTAEERYISQASLVRTILAQWFEANKSENSMPKTGESIHLDGTPIEFKNVYREILNTRDIVKEPTLLHIGSQRMYRRLF